MITNFGVLDVGQKYVERELIDILRKNLVFYKTAKIQKVPKGANAGLASNSIVFRGFNRLSEASTPLTEGVVPAGSALSMYTKVGQLAQYGDYVTITDLAEFLYDRSLIKDASEVLGIQAEETIDGVIRDVIGAGTSVLYGNGTVSTRATVTSAMVVTSALLTRIVRFLERNDVKKFPRMPVIGQAYAGVFHPDQLYDLRTDTNFVSAINYSSPNPSNPDRGDLFTGEYGFWMGVRIISTTHAPTYAAAGVSSANLYGALIYGDGAYAVSELAEGLQTYIHTAGSNLDPLNQFSTVGWKWTGTAVILDNNRLVRWETSATYTLATVKGN